MHLVAYAFYDSLYTLLHGCIEAFTAILGNPHDVISTIVDAMRGFPVHIFYTLNLHLVYFIVTIGLKPTGFRTQGQRRNDAGLGLRAFRSRRLALKSLRPGFRTQDMEIIENQFLTVGLFEGPVNSDVFYAWLIQDLIPKLPPESVVAMDNAAFHKRADMLEALEQAGHILLYLPPYSPDLNPIEKKWAYTKARRRQHRCTVLDLFRTL